MVKKTFVHHIRTSEPIHVKIDGKNKKAIIIKPDMM